MTEISKKTAKKPRGKPFPKGKTGNPGGRPKRTQEEIDLIAACKAKTMDALMVIEGIMNHGDNERNRLSAALSIIERAYGKPEQPIDANLNGSITVEILRFGGK